VKSFIVYFPDLSLAVDVTFDPAQMFNVQNHFVIFDRVRLNGLEKGGKIERVKRRKEQNREK
jgi:hypothetical protein